MKRYLLLVCWIGGMFVPLLAIRTMTARNITWFDQLFASEWLHIAAHTALYASLVLLLWNAARWPWQLRTLCLTIFVVLAVSFVQEGLQVAVAGRWFSHREGFDFGINQIGGAIGLAFVRLALPRLT